MDFQFKTGDRVVVRGVEESIFLFLDNKEGVITQVLDSPVRKIRGYIIRFVGIDGPEKEWFMECKYVEKKEEEEE